MTTMDPDDQADLEPGPDDDEYDDLDVTQELAPVPYDENTTPEQDRF